MNIEKKQIRYNYQNRLDKIKHIIIHDTANTGKGADRYAHFNYFNGGDRNASADIFVDSNGSLQINDYNKYYSWAVGDGLGKYGITNGNSISIEMCINSDGDYNKAFNNLIEVTRQLMNELNISISNVVRHYDASRKMCPRSMSANSWGKWNEFKEKLVEERKVYDMKNMVCYCNQVDKRAAEYLADYLRCPCMDANNKFDYKNVAESLIAVGDGNMFSGYTTKKIQGKDRYDTMKEVLKFMNRL